MKTASRIGGFVGRLVSLLPLPARSMANRNIHRAFPGILRTKRKSIVRNSFANQGRNLFELFTFDHLTRSIVDELVEFEGRECLERAFKKGNGVLILGAHFGNWELMGASLSLWGYPVNVIARKIYIEGINNLLVRLRNNSGVRVILRSEEGSAKKILRALKKNEIIGIIIDQDAHVPGVMTTFFGYPAYTPLGLAALALKSRAAVVSGFIRRDNGRHVLQIRGPIDMIRTGDHQRDIVKNTQLFTDVIEEYVRRFPDQWVWMHDRWRHITSEQTLV